MPAPVGPVQNKKSTNETNPSKTETERSGILKGPLIGIFLISLATIGVIIVTTQFGINIPHITPLLKDFGIVPPAKSAPYKSANEPFDSELKSSVRQTHKETDSENDATENDAMENDATENVDLVDKVVETNIDKTVETIIDNPIDSEEISLDEEALKASELDESVEVLSDESVQEVSVETVSVETVETLENIKTEISSDENSYETIVDTVAAHESLRDVNDGLDQTSAQTVTHLNKEDQIVSGNNAVKTAETEAHETSTEDDVTDKFVEEDTDEISVNSYIEAIVDEEIENIHNDEIETLISEVNIDTEKITEKVPDEISQTLDHEPIERNIDETAQAAIDETEEIVILSDETEKNS